MAKLGKLMGFLPTTDAARTNERGVAFEKYPFVQDKELGIWSAPGGAKVSWFKDPDGNILSLTES